MPAEFSTLTVYDGRTLLAHIEVRWKKGCAEYRARLVGGHKVGEFPTLAAASAAIDEALAPARADGG